MAEMTRIDRAVVKIRDATRLALAGLRGPECREVLETAAEDLRDLRDALDCEGEGEEEEGADDR